jgi:hypothetical protein
MKAALGIFLAIMAGGGANAGPDSKEVPRVAFLGFEFINSSLEATARVEVERIRLLDDVFQKLTSKINAEPRMFVFRYRSPQHWLDVFKTFYGPMLKAFAALDSNAQVALARDILALADEFNRADDGAMAVPSEYLEVVITKR